MPTRSNKCPKCNGHYDPERGHTCPKKLILSLTAADMNWDFFRAGGKGGQNQNKRSTGVRCKHLPSGAVGEARDGRTQAANRKAAFRRCVETRKFRDWLKVECARRLGVLEEIERIVEEQMNPNNMQVEVREKGRWILDNINENETKADVSF